MRFAGHSNVELDEIDLRILGLLQEDCRTSLVRIGEQVGLSAPAVLERIKKLEAAGIVTGYRAILDARRLGLDPAEPAPAQSGKRARRNGERHAHAGRA